MKIVKEETLRNVAGGENTQEKLSIIELEKGKYTVVGENQIFSTEKEAQDWVDNIKKALEQPSVVVPAPDAASEVKPNKE